MENEQFPRRFSLGHSTSCLWLSFYQCSEAFIYMNKMDLISAISDDSGITKTQAQAAVSSFIQQITKELSKGGSVSLVGFGTFATRKRGARKGRNPATGAVIDISASTYPVFKPGKVLKDSVNR